MERKTQLEPLSTARKKKDLFIAIAGAKRKTPSLTDMKSRSGDDARRGHCNDGSLCHEPSEPGQQAVVFNRDRDGHVAIG